MLRFDVVLARNDIEVGLYSRLPKGGVAANCREVLVVDHLGRYGKSDPLGLQGKSYLRPELRSIVGKSGSSAIVICLSDRRPQNRILI